MSNQMSQMQPVNAQLDYLFKCALVDALDGVPRKFVYTWEGLPSTGNGLYELWSRGAGSEFRLFNGSNDAQDLYFSPSTNLAYRAVHDVDHAVAYSVGQGTTKYEDELYLNCLMAKRAYDYAVHRVPPCVAHQLFVAVYHDTVGLVHYYKQYNDFCADQRSNTAKLLSECLGNKYAKMGNIRQANQVMLAMLVECGLWLQAFILAVRGTLIPISAGTASNLLVFA